MQVINLKYLVFLSIVKFNKNNLLLQGSLCSLFFLSMNTFELFLLNLGASFTVAKFLPFLALLS